MLRMAVPQNAEHSCDCQALPLEAAGGRETAAPVVARAMRIAMLHDDRVEYDSGVRDGVGEAVVSNAG